MNLIHFDFPLLGSMMNVDHGLKIYTYGGGEVLQKIFNLVSIICGSKFADYEIAIWIAVNIGLLVAVIMSMTKMTISPIWKQWLIPVLLTVSLFTVNTEKVVIYDHLVKKDAKQKTYVVDNVPLLLAYTAHFFSSLSHGMTQMLEDGAHIVDDGVYNWTGHIYAGKSLFNTRKMKIIDEVTKENFRNFCSECVFRDLGLGLYTKEELGKAPNLFDFLKKHTSRIRGVQYRQPNTPLVDNTMQSSGVSSMISCQNAISKIHSHLNGELANSKELLAGFIGSEYQHLIDKSANAPIQELIEQQIAIDTLKGYTVGRYDTLASKRAEQLQIASQKILGSMGANILLASRNYFEALLYGIFPLVIVVSLISLGFRVLLGWIQIIAWVSFWPPCFVIANFVLDCIWEIKKGSMGFSSRGYSLVMSDGLFELYNHMEGIACGIFLTIPLLSWGLLYLSKGGASALVHWASSFTNAAQGVSNIAAGEATTGNYNYKNVGLSSQGFGNVTQNQRNLSPMLSEGTTSTQDAAGRATTSLQGDGLSLDERKSNLLTDISNSEAFTNSVQSHLREAESVTQGESATLSQSVSHTVNSAQGLNKHLSNNAGLSEGWDRSSLSNVQKQTQKIYTQAEEYGKTHNMDTAEVFDEAIRVGAGGGILLKAGLDESLSNRFTDSNGHQKSERLSDARSLYEGMQHLEQTIHRNAGSLSSEQGFRDYQDFADAFSQTESSATGLNAAYSRQKSLETLQSGVKSQDLRVSQNLNNAFVDHLGTTLGDKATIQETLTNPEMRQRAVDGFVRNFAPKSFEPGVNLKQEYAQETKNLDDSKAHEWSAVVSEGRVQKEGWQNMINTEIPESGGIFEGTDSFKALEKKRKHDFKRLNQDHALTGERFEQGKQQFEEDSKAGLVERSWKDTMLWNGVKSTGKFLGKPSSSAKPYDPGLPGWDTLTDKQKMAIIDDRMSDYMP